MYKRQEYILKNFSPGVYEFFHGEVGMTEDDMKHEQAYWHEYVPVSYTHLPGVKVLPFRKQTGETFPR